VLQKKESGVLGVELDDLLEVELQQLRQGPAVAGEPEDVLEQDGVDVDEEAPSLLLPRRRLQEDAERVGVEHATVHRERPPLLPDHHRHRRRFVGGGVEGAVAEAGVRGRRPPEEDAAAGHGEADGAAASRGTVSVWQQNLLLQAFVREEGIRGACRAWREANSFIWRTTRKVERTVGDNLQARS
jgi:hypothetical protein